jgi:hypothetical protein
LTGSSVTFIYFNVILVEYIFVINKRALLFVTGEFEQEKQECLHVMLLVVDQNITPLFEEIIKELVLKLFS